MNSHDYRGTGRTNSAAHSAEMYMMAGTTRSTMVESGSIESRLWTQMSSGNEMSNSVRHRDVLYLFACHLEWRDRRNVAAYQELVAALDDSDAFGLSRKRC
jgi:hypothetical protein